MFWIFPIAGSKPAETTALLSCRCWSMIIVSIFLVLKSTDILNAYLRVYLIHFPHDEMRTMGFVSKEKKTTVVMSPFSSQRVE